VNLGGLTPLLFFLPKWLLRVPTPTLVDFEIYMALQIAAAFWKIQSGSRGVNSLAWPHLTRDAHLGILIKFFSLKKLATCLMKTLAGASSTFHPFLFLFISILATLVIYMYTTDSVIS
jgi:hypothetical protein